MEDIRDPRFGGNMERANVGKQYSRAFPGGPPGVDQRYENYQSPHRVDYTSPRPPQSTGTSNRVTTPKQHPNPRMRGMMGGLGGLQEQAAVDPSDWRTILRILEAGGDPGTETALNIGDTFPLEGLGSRPGEGYGSGSGRDYGSTYEELETIPLDMQFDQWGYPIGGDDWGYIGAARGGLMSLRR